MDPDPVEQFLCRLAAGHLYTRRDAEQLLGRDEVARLIASGEVVDNPFTERLEVARETEDFYP
jgi:hypothetical protein